MKKKLLTAAILTVAAIALVVATVLTTIAYLTASAAVSNTFTVGNVMIQMYESKVDSDGNAITDDPNVNGAMKDSDGNNYHLLPGKTYVKDPTIYVDAGSDASYLFVKIRNNISSIELGNYIHTGATQPIADPNRPTIAAQMTANGWVLLGTTSTGDVYVFSDTTTKKAKAVGGTGAMQTVPVFEEFTVDEHADVSLYGGAKVTLTAFAIQTAGFVDNTETTDKDEAVLAAWAAIVETYPYESGALTIESN